MYEMNNPLKVSPVFRSNIWSVGHHWNLKFGHMGPKVGFSDNLVFTKINSRNIRKSWNEHYLKCFTCLELQSNLFKLFEGSLEQKTSESKFFLPLPWCHYSIYCMLGLPFGSIDWFLYEGNTAIHKIKLIEF